MTRIIAFMLMFLALASIDVTAERRSVYIEGEKLSLDDQFNVAVSSNLSSLWVEVRAAVSGNKERVGMSVPEWKIHWTASDSSHYDCAISWGNTDFASIYDKRFMRVSINRFGNQVLSWDVTEGVDLGGGYNSVALLFNGDKLLVQAGDKTLSLIGEGPICSMPVGAVSITSNRGLDLKEVRLIEENLLRAEIMTSWTIDKLDKYFASSTDGREGYWEYLDRETDSSLSGIGGKYTLAIVRSGEGYDIIYIDGARVDADKWRPGMKKGELRSTVFENHYHLYWYDSAMNFLGRDYEFNADYAASLWTFNFPLLSSRLRFSRQPSN